jgi:sugar-specific transcriptional regulator TrmB
MLEDTQVLRAYFAKLGLEPEIAELYLALHAYGPQTISELARRSKVERTRIYRLLDDFAASSLIEIETRYKRSIIKAAPISNLQILLSKKEEELRSLQSGLAAVQRAVLRHEKTDPSTQVQFYKDIEGLKQMFWNETKSTTGNLSILYENMQNKTNAAFFERWVREFNRHGITSRSLIGDHFLETQKNWYNQRDNERIAQFESRYVPTNIFDITHSIILYNDVVAYYNWRQGNIFGIEIHNQGIADAQRTFFEMLWAQSKPVPKAISQQLKDKDTAKGA